MFVRESEKRDPMGKLLVLRNRSKVDSCLQALIEAPGQFNQNMKQALKSTQSC